MPQPPVLLSGLSAIAADYDALICDVWGVVHNGTSAHPRAAAALKNFRAAHGPVVLLSNAPRPAEDVRKQFDIIGVPHDCYDAIVTSGGAARQDLAARAATRRLAMLHLGPQRDHGLFDGLNVECVDAARAEVVLLTGLYDDDNDVPDDYTGRLAELKARGLTLLCANPDIVVQRGGHLVYCAGALAREYEAMGGKVVYYGKPHPEIYGVALAAAGRALKRPLAIGDGLETDIRGANRAGIDALFIAGGIHGEDVAEFTQGHMAELFAKAGVTARAAMRTLMW